MRKTIAIVISAVVAASCIPWLRHQHFFSVLGAVITVALFGFLVFGGLRTLSTWLRGIPIEPCPKQFGWRSLTARARFLAAAIIVALGFSTVHFVGTGNRAYSLAVATARQSTEFRDVLGIPVTEGWFPEFKF